MSSIEDAHDRHVQHARHQAERLASEAAQATEEGIRDLVDADAESDAAIAAVMVRQLSARVMHAAKRVRELEERGDALAFGHTTTTEGERWYIGRHSVIDGDDVLLVDWRADLAIPFYRATFGDPLGLISRRHFHYDDDRQLQDYSDELFTPAEALEVQSDNSQSASRELRGDAALMAALAAPSQGHMRSVVATIQAEQDRVIRASPRKPLVVQGGPGTGKTVVALHRAAYLLYNDRTELSETGVLLIGPSPQFLAYIKRVLPSLGETGVVSVTPSELFPGVRRGHVDSAAAARLKGDLRMADLLVAAMRDRQRRPTADLEVWYGSTRVVLEAATLVQLFELASRTQTHNAGATVFAELVHERLLAEVYHPSFDNRADATQTFKYSSTVRRFLLGHWPTLTPEQLLNDLFGSPGLLRSAAEKAGLSRVEARLLYRERTLEADMDRRAWSEADMPLLDEAFSLLVGSIGDEVESHRQRERDAATEFEEATAKDDGVDLAGFSTVSDDDGGLGLADADYEAAEKDWDERTNPTPAIHPKFQALLEKSPEADIG